VITDERLVYLIARAEAQATTQADEDTAAALRELRQLRSEKQQLKSDLEDSCRRVHTLERQANESANAFQRELTALRQPLARPEWIDGVRNRALHYPEGQMLDDLCALLRHVNQCDGLR